MIWFNPQYSNNVKSNVGKKFLRFVMHHFPKDHKLNKVFNKNILKVSYSFMRSISSILTSHNKKTLAENKQQYECNCRNKDECPLENKCLTSQIIYEAEFITLKTSRKFYIGLSDTSFKERYNNHMCDFRNKRYEKSTELSKYIWSLQESGIEFTIHCKILRHVKGMIKRRYCSLCLTEKLWLLHYFDDIGLLNKRSEFISKCRHETMLLISSTKYSIIGNKFNHKS